MHIVITGGAGFLGRCLGARLLERGELVGEGDLPRRIDKIVLFDSTFDRDRGAGENVVFGTADGRVRTIAGDVCDPEALAGAIAPGTTAVFHLAAVVSGEAEADFDAGMHVNVDGTRAVLEACRALPEPPRVVFSSSVAVFGGELPEVVQDATAPTPQSSYGVQKLIGELLVCDYTRKGFIDGRSIRLPTVCVRPGKPNRAASGFASAIIREPLNGRSAVCPVSPETVMWLMSPQAAADNLMHAHNLPAAAWWPDRAVNLPGLSVSVDEMVSALGRVTDVPTARRVQWRPDPAVEALVLTWPGRFNPVRANTMGFRGDPDFDWIVRAYMEEAAVGGSTP